MRSFISIFFLLLLMAIWLKPLYPYIEYALNKEYIAKNLCENKDKPQLECNGKCHLAKQIEKVMQEEDNPSKPFIPNNTETEITLFFYDTQILHADLCENVDKEQFTFITPHCSQTYTDIPTPPPRLSLC